MKNSSKEFSECEKIFQPSCEGKGKFMSQLSLFILSPRGHSWISNVILQMICIFSLSFLHTFELNTAKVETCNALNSCGDGSREWDFAFMSEELVRVNWRSFGWEECGDTKIFLSYATAYICNQSHGKKKKEDKTSNRIQKTNLLVELSDEFTALWISAKLNQSIFKAFHSLYSS